MISVERQLPRKMRIIRPVSAAADTPSKMTERHRRLDEGRLIADRVEAKPAGSVSRSFGSSALTPSITSRVEAEPDFRIVIRTAFEPSTRTMLVCGGAPAWTKATS